MLFGKGYCCSCLPFMELRAHFGPSQQGSDAPPGAVYALAQLSGVGEAGLECWLRGAPERAAACPLPDACEALLLATFAAALEVSQVHQLSLQSLAWL